MTRMHWIAAAVLTAALFIVPAFAQSTSPAPHDHEHTATAPAPAQKAGMMGHDHKRMMADMKTADDRLQQLVSKMNAATGEQKTNAIAELLTQLVTEHTNMHHHMMEKRMQRILAQ